MPLFPARSAPPSARPTHALDVEKLNLADGFTLDELRKVMHGHVLAQAELVGTYAIYAKAAVHA